MAMNSGESAEHAAEGTLAAAASAELEEHEELGDKAVLFPLVLTTMVLVSFLPWRWVRIVASWLAVGAGAAGAAWVANTAHHGGTLVYTYGVGTPAAGARNPGGAGPGVDETPGDDDSETAAAAVAADPRLVHFRRHVLPVLEERCWKCHNPIRKRRSGGLDQTTMASLLTGGKSGAAVVPGSAAESLILARLTTEVEDDIMPPTGRLPEATIAAFEQWIDEGAVWDETIVPPIPAIAPAAPLETEAD
jgi:hypothetical protein